MKATGSLLRETLEHEARLSNLIAQAEEDAARLTEEAGRKAYAMRNAAEKECDGLIKQTALEIQAEAGMIARTWKKKSSEKISAMNDSFKNISEALAEKIAEGIMRHGT